METPPNVVCEKPKLPALWIDTSVIIKITKVARGEALQQVEVDRVNQLRALVEDLSQKNKLLCPQADQEEEYTAIRLDREIQGEFLGLSMGIRMRHRAGVIDTHVMTGMKAYVKDEAEITISSSSFFHGDPVAQQLQASTRGFVIGTTPFMHQDEIDRRAKGKEEVQKAWERLRQEFVASKVSYEEQLAAEEVGIADTMGIRLTQFDQSVQQGKADLWAFFGVEDLLLYNVYWKEIGGQPEGFAGIEQFFRSRYFNNLPIQRVKNQLGADLLTGNQVIVPSDVMDVELMGAAIPISHFVLTDKRVADRVKRRKIDAEWNTEVFSMQTIDDLFTRLRAL